MTRTRYTTLDMDAVRFRADMETMRYIAAAIMAAHHTTLPYYWSLEDETAHHTGININAVLADLTLAVTS